MRYICYLSKERVDTLFASAFDGIVDDVTSKKASEGSGSLDIGLSQVLSWIKAGLTFGGKRSHSVETKRRQNAVSRLAPVLAYIEREHTTSRLIDAVDKGRLESDLFEVNSSFSVPTWDPDSPAVDLLGQVRDFHLTLSCGKHNFSGLHAEGDRVIPTSTNRFLFEGKLSLPMNGLIKLAGVDPKHKRIYGSPLYLVLNPLERDLGDFNDVEI